MFLVYQYKLKPNEKAKKQLEYVLWQDRMLYNGALQKRIAYYEETGKLFTLDDQYKSFIKNSHDCFEGDRERQRAVLARLDKAFRGFFRRVKAGENPGFPRFKSRNRWNSIEIPYEYEIENGRFYSRDFPDGIKIHMHRPLPDGIMRHCRAILKKTCKGWQINLQIAVRIPDQRAVKKEVGIDVGLGAFITTSDGEQVFSPKHYGASEKKLKRLHRVVSRAKKGSNNRKKKVAALARQHMKVANQRKDFQHKRSRKLVDKYDAIYAEDLNIKRMLKNKDLSESILDAAWGAFLSKVAYKAEEAGKHFIQVDPKKTSQICSGCGAIVKKSLYQRVHKCTKCKLEIDRDINAALNIKRLGQSLMTLTDG